jgi:hypothetical protein
MQNQQPYPFNERGTLDSIINSNAYAYFQKLANGQKLSRLDKDTLFHNIQANSGKGNYMLMGMIIPFKQFMKLYLVKYNYENTWHEIYAFDKTCIRNSFYTNSCVSSIMEFNQIK